MFKLEEYDDSIACKELTLTDDLFHVALADGERRYHVRNPRGDDFDIVYLDNNDDREPFDRYPAYIKGPLIARYHTYDETDRDTLYLEFLDGYETMAFEELNEYTIALTKVVLAFTSMQVYSADERIFCFVPVTSRVRIYHPLPDLPTETTLYVQAQYETGLLDRSFNPIDSVYAFHNVFFFQWMLDGRKLDGLKYATMTMGDIGGIGSVLAYYKRFERVFRRFGLKLISREDHMGKFKVDMLDKYFSLGLTAEDATDENTLTVTNHVILIKTKFVYASTRPTDTSILAPSFRAEMDEYYDALFAGKKVLGILIRGSDYISTGLTGERLMATVDQMLPMIRSWISKDHYDKIFLATEDSDILQQMRDEFGKMVVAVAQERISVHDLRPGQVISELEKETNTPEEYDAAIEETTINYFYALYILSRCDSFMCSGQCNGWDVVNGFNGGAFMRSYKFSVGVDK